MVLSGAGEDMQLTLGEPGAPGAACSLRAVRMRGCSPAARRRLRVALRVLQSVAAADPALSGPGRAPCHES